MRQSAQNQRSLMQQGRSARLNDLALARTQQHLAEAFSRTGTGVPLDPAQVEAVNAWLMALFWAYEDSYLQFQAGTLDKPGWDTDVATLKLFLALPECRASWRLNRVAASGGYRAFVDSLMEQIAPAPMNPDLWKAIVAEELAKARA